VTGDPIYELEVMNSWLVQGSVTWGGRKFWYKCDSGRQYLAELDTSSGDEFAELDSTCLCEVFGRECDESACCGLFSDDLVEHEHDAGLLLEVLLRRSP
jgi:hypothetical protein